LILDFALIKADSAKIYETLSRGYLL